MAVDVGVLQLTIEDNSKAAASGLKPLVAALEKLQQITSQATGIGLKSVASELNQMSKQINSAKNTGATIKNIAAMGKALTDLSKVKDIINFNVEPLKELKKAIGDGITLKGNPSGQLAKIRDVLSTEWNGESAIQSMNGIKDAVNAMARNDTAGKLSVTAKAMEEYAKAAKKMPSTQGVEEATEDWKGQPGRMSGKFGAGWLNKFAEKTNEATVAVNDWRMAMAEASAEAAKGQTKGGMFSGLENLDEMLEKVAKATEYVNGLANAIKNVREVSEGGQIKGIAATIRSISATVNDDMSGSTFQKTRDFSDAIRSLAGAGNGINLEGVASAIRGVARAINENISFETITTLDLFADALSKLRGLGNININLRGARDITKAVENGTFRNGSTEIAVTANTSAVTNALADVNQSVETVQVAAREAFDFSQFDAARLPLEAIRMSMEDVRNGIQRIHSDLAPITDVVAQINTELATTIGDLSQINSLIENVADSSNESARAFEQLFAMWNQIRMARSLMSGDAGLPEGGAIPVEGTVTDPYENMNARLSETIKYLEAVGVKTIGMVDYLEQASSATRDVGNSVNAIIPYAEHYEETWAGICQRMHEVTSIRGIIWSGSELGDALRGALGTDAFEEAVRTVSENTGLSRENIIRQVADELDRYRNVLHEAEDEARSVAAQQENMGAAGEAVGRGAERAAAGFAEMQDQAQRANPMLDLLREKLRILEWELSHRMTMRGRFLDDKQMTNLAIQIEKTRAQIQLMESDFGSVGNITGAMVHDLVNNTSQIELMRMRLNDMQRALIEDINLNKLDAQQIAERTMRIQNLREEINRLVETELRAQMSGNFDMSTVFESTAQAVRAVGTNLPTVNSIMENYQNLLAEVSAKQGDTANSAGVLSRSFNYVKDGIQRMFPTLTGMIKRFGQIAKYRALRYVLKAITSGLSEGIKNVYQYSSAINGHFAAAMDNAASSLLLMKNSLGAAAAPLVEMLIPYLQQVVNWFVNLLNYANQFFALLNGQSSWTRAVPTTTKAFGNQEKAAKGASNAIKDLLADWDELNIIQSESGKGAGSGASGSAENYLEMFEEVGKFSNKVRDVVDYIQENIGSILTDVGLIAAAILGWKLSGAFAGALGTIGAIAGTVATFAVVFDVSKQFNTKFLDTGEPGYLVADLLTTMLGGLATKALISKVLGTAAGTVAFGLTFAVSAAAGIIANVASTDVSTLSQKSIVSSIVTALKGWAAVTAAGKGLFNLGLGEAAANGAIGALATFAVAIGIKADAQVSKEGLDEETIGAKLLSVLGLAATGAAIAAKTGADIEGVAGMAMLFGGAPITTLGIAVGIHAINKVVDAREITSEVIGENLVAGGLIGFGLGISSAAVVGGTLATIIGTGGAALAIGALFAIEAYIADKPIKVVWGNYDATKEEIENYIESYFYSTPPTVTINTIKASIKDVTDASETLGNDMSDLLGTLDVLHLGLDPSTPDDVRTQIQKLVSSYNNATQKYQNLLQVAVTLTPVSKVGEDGTEQDISSGIVQNSKNRWDVLNNEMTRLGEELADTYKVAYNARLDGNVDEIAEQTIKELSGMMSDIAAAIATGQTKAKVGHVLKEQIKNLSQESMHDFLQMYREQREALIKELMDARGKAAEGLLAQAYSFEDLAEKALERAGGNTADATYQRYKELAKEAYDDYEAAMENVRKDAENAADNLIDSKEKDKIRETLLGNIKTVINTKDMEEVFGLGGVFDTNKFSKYITDRLITGSLGEGEAKARAEEARGSFESFMNELLVELVGEDNFADYREAIDNNLIKWGDLFPADFASKIFESFNLNDVPEAERNNVQKKLAEIINSIFGNGTVSAPEPVVDTTEVQDTATEIMDQVQEAVDNSGSVKVGVEPEIKATANPEIVSEIFSLFKKTSFLPNFTEMFEEGLEELDIKYGVDEVDKALEESGVLKNYYGITIPLKFELDENSQNIVDLVNELKQNDGTSGNAGSPILGRFSTSQLTASTGYSDSNVGNARTRLSGEETTYTQTADPAGEKQRIQEGVETGVRKGNADQNQLLQQAVNLLLQIARKDFTVNVTPNSSWGRFGSQSNEYYERVGGETVSKW